jgi:hypothetical protein
MKDWIQDNPELFVLICLAGVIAVLGFWGMSDTVTAGITGIFAFLNKRSPEEQKLNILKHEERERTQRLERLETKILEDRQVRDWRLAANAEAIQQLEKDAWDDIPILDLIDSGNNRDYGTGVR